MHEKHNSATAISSLAYRSELSMYFKIFLHFSLFSMFLVSSQDIFFSSGGYGVKPGGGKLPFGTTTFSFFF